MKSDRPARYRRLQADRVLDETANRKRQLGRIHAAKKQLALDDTTYRSLLERITGLRSSADMTHAQRNDVLAEFSRLGFKAEAATRRSRPDQDKPKNLAEVPMLRKVAALLAQGKRTWAYAHAMAKHMHQVARVEWLNPQQLHALVSALQIDANRNAKKKPSP